MTRRGIRLTPKQAAQIATAELGRRIPAATIRSWRHRDELAGGPGWVDGEDLLRIIAREQRRANVTQSGETRKREQR